MTARSRARAAVGLVAAAHTARTAPTGDQDVLTDAGAALLADLLADGPAAGALTLVTMTRDVVRWASRATGVPVEQLLDQLGQAADRRDDGG